MPKTLFQVDLTKPMDQQELPGHNRWHPDIPAVVSVNPGDVFRIECKDWTDGQIKNDDSPDDIRDVDLTVVHVLSGPIHVNGAEPGDILVVDLVDIGALQGDEWGFTGIFDKKNGGGFLTDHYPDPAKAIWDFQGIYTTSRHIPGVKFAGIIHPGLIGCAPSHELLATWNKREKELVDTAPDLRTYGAGLSGDKPVLAALPNPKNAILGQLPKSEFDRVAVEGARTVPPREHGGNCDIKNLSKGTRIYFPVYVEGAKLSMGDIHFSQGDGEISFCGAIEMSGFIDIHVDIIKGGVEKYGMVNPIFKPGPVEPRFSEYLVFEGISVDEFTGKQHYMDVHIAYRRACLNAIEYLKKFGYTGEQAYLLLSCAPVEGRVSGIVDIPNACCTVAIPTAIFDKPILPV
ncbi:acetamidase/formamidase family protein [Phormidium sp. FACHB-592]|uniref:Acetamidase/formamidase family protein n=1 Tax=Stenomitos frigidus AS-A4 TaxID=2933935 RepID=A0ABV0KJI3_9CYAN|nr:formamidase [Phormidium sp. FACHB-592]MBD2074701.1 acetamidase/formamidase family protein [Phormidium sp. FACHB-592]